VLEAYRKDQQKVERGFRFLKDPLFMASTLFLKSPRRIMTLCLMVYAALEHRIRQGLAEQSQAYPDQKGKPTERPTARWVFPGPGRRRHPLRKPVQPAPLAFRQKEAREPPCGRLRAIRN